MDLEYNSEPQPFVCPFGGCGLGFPEIPLLKSHYFTFHLKKRKYHCDFCPKRLPTLQSLLKHVKEHNNSKPFHCTLLGCLCKFAREENLIIHLKKKHELGTSFMQAPAGPSETHGTTVSETAETDLMEEIIDAKLSMPNSDLDTKPAPETVLEGEEIGFSYGSGVPGFVCKWCAKEHASPTALILHTLSHTTGGQIMCAFCLKGYSQRHNFVQHLKFMHPEVSADAIEDQLLHHNGDTLKRFPWRNDEEGAEETVGQVLPPPEENQTITYICPLCVAAFRHKELMSTHTLIVHHLKGELVYEEDVLSTDQSDDEC